MPRTNNSPTVFIDLDGVLADFVGAVLKLHGYSEDVATTMLDKMKGSYSIEKTLDMSPTAFWAKINRHPSFWETLSQSSEADMILDTVEWRAGHTNIYLLSAPSFSPDCYAGKAKWVKTYYPKYYRNLILTTHKHLLAHSDALLIDDSDRNCDQFRLSGGRAILFPRPWNSKYPFAHKPLDLFNKEIKRFL